MTDGGRRRAQTVIALVALASGVVGFFLASGLPFAAPKGAIMGSLMSFNRLGALVTIGLAIVGLAGVRAGNDAIAGASGAGFLLAAAVQLVQAGRDVNLLGGRPSTFSFFLAAGAGLLVLALAPDSAGRPSESGDH